MGLLSERKAKTTTLKEAKEILMKEALCENQYSLGCDLECEKCAFDVDIRDRRYLTALNIVSEHYIKKHAKLHISAVYGKTMEEGEQDDCN